MERLNLQSVTDVLRDGIQIYAIRGVTVLSNFGAMLLLALILGIEDYGSFVLIWAMAAVTSSFVSLGMPVYLMKELSIADRWGKDGVGLGYTAAMVVLWPAAICAGFFAIASIPIASASLELWGIAQGDFALLLGLAYLMNLNINLSSIVYAIGYQGYSMFQRDAVPQLLALAVAFFVVVQAMAQPATLVLIGVCILLAAFTIFVIAFLAFHHFRQQYFGDGSGAGRWQGAFWGSAVLGLAWAQIDIVIGGLFLSPAQLGAYNILRRIANLVTLPATISNWTTIGDFSRAFAQHDREAVLATNRKALVLGAIPGFLLLLVAIPAYVVIDYLYAFPEGEGFFLLFLMLLAQAGIVVHFLAGTSILSTSGLETSAMFCRLAGLIAYLIALAILFALIPSAVHANAAALFAGSIVLYGLVWLVVYRNHGFDSSVGSLIWPR
ncbi:hypothetical protein [Erythrobacter crassostreae]|uniref:Polysaccharide biosynthesis protein n=1 Tax=Erythrobacter crassostreae TaxID=2828328 RepID=A0A9X1JK15_9SPHN|nr:hypothetical protein [Erythrobacter crassostrea]MBV7258520.1 hypothetical protein [Erythrobacter crassostrea]